MICRAPIFCAATTLVACGGSPPGIEHEHAAGATAARTLASQNIDGNLVSRNAAIAEILRRDEAQLLTDWPVDIRTPLQDGNSATQLAQLLGDQPYRATFTTADGAQRLATLEIGALDEFDAIADPDESDSALDADTMLATQLAAADSEEQIYLIDDAELSSDNLRVLASRLKVAPATSEEAKLQQGIMRRLDLGDEVGARLAVLDALNSPNDTVVEMALDSIDTWNDRSIEPWLRAAVNHPNPIIAERIALTLSDIELIAPVPAGPAPTGVDLNDLLNEATERRERLQKQRAERFQ